MLRSKLAYLFTAFLILVTLLSGACGGSAPVTSSAPNSNPASNTAPPTTSVSTKTTASAATSTTAQTQSQAKPIVFKFGGLFPSTHPAALIDAKGMKLIEEKTNGRIKIEPYWGATLISQANSFIEISKGVADLGGLVLNYGAPGLKFHDATSGFWYGISDRKNARQWYQQILEQIPEEKAQFNACKILLIEGGTTYHALTKKPVRTIADFKGLTLKVPEGYHPAFKAIGAQPVVVPMTEVYTSLQKGILDGTLAPYETYTAFNFDEVVKYATRLELVYPFPTVAMNLNAYNNIPPDLKIIFDEAVAEWDELRFDSFETTNEAGFQKGKASGVEFINLSDEENAKLYGFFDSEAAKTATELDAQGLPGTKYLNLLKSLKASAGK